MSSNRTGDRPFNSNSYHSELDAIDVHATLQDRFASGDVALRVFRVLGRMRNPHVLIIGIGGVGKTDLVEKLVGRIHSGDVPRGVSGAQVLRVDAVTLYADTTYPNEPAVRLDTVFRKASASGQRTVVVLDHFWSTIHRMPEPTHFLKTLLRPGLDRIGICLMSTATIDEYRTYILPDRSLARRLQPIWIAELSAAESLANVRAVAPDYEQHHEVQFAESALIAAVRLGKCLDRNCTRLEGALALLEDAATEVRMAPASGPVDGVVMITHRDVLSIVRSRLGEGHNGAGLWT